MKSEKGLVIIGFTLITIIWGSTWLVIKLGLESITPFYGIAIRFTIASTVLYAMMRMKGEKLRKDRKSIMLYLNLAILSFSFPFALVYWGEKYIASGLASVLFAAYPFVVAAFSHIFLPSEKMTLNKFIGIVFGFVGVVIIFWSDLNLGSASTLGMIAVLLSTVMQGSSLVFVKRMNHPISPMSLSLGGMLFGIIIMYPIAFFFEDLSKLKFDLTGIGSILYLGTFGSVVTFVAYYWLMKRVEVVYLSLVSFVTPILAVILGAVWLKESLSKNISFGASFVLIGIIIANSKDLINALVHKSGRTAK